MLLAMGSVRRFPVRAGVLAAVAAAVVGLLPGSGPVSAAVDDGSLGIRLVDAPEERRDDPRARVYIVDHLGPGATITRRVEVTNSTEGPMQVRLYAGPARIVDGVFAPDDPGATSDLTSWTGVGQESVTLAAGEALEVPVTIAVPDDASEGERYGAIWAETESTGDGQVQQVSRVGIRIYLSIGPGGEPASDFRIESLQARRLENGKVEVAARVENTGGRALDLEGSLRLKDGPGGLSAGPFATAERTTLGPGGVGVVTVELPAELPAGPWRAVMTLRSGQLERSAEASLTFPEQGEATPVDAEQVDDGWPWWWYALPVALLLLLLFLFWAWRRSRSQEHRH